MTDLKILFLETRPPFLLLTTILVSLGAAVAYSQGFFNPLFFILTLTGVLLAHVSVNVLNDYFDYKSGLDSEIVNSGRKTPFSGGSGLLTSKLISPETTFKMGMASFISGLAIGLYFIYLKGLLLLPIIAVAAASAVFYTNYFAKHCLGEFIAGLNFGPLMVLGTYIIQAGYFNILKPLAASIAPGILTANLLLLNQFPDAEADEKVGRRHLVILLGRRKASKLYTALTTVSYISIILFVIAKLMPLTALTSLATVPFAYKACSVTLKHYNSLNKLTEALKQNVIMVLVTQALLVVRYLL